MAEIVLSTAELARIDRDLDALVMPSYETVRRLVAETRRARESVFRLSGALAEVGSVVDRAGRESP